MFQKLLNWLDGQPITLVGWITGFIPIVLLRCMLEVFSSPSNYGYLESDAVTLAHYGLLFLAIALAIAHICFRCVGDAGRLQKILLLGLPIIWLGPSLDLLISGGAKLSYLVHAPFAMIVDFFIFLTPWSVISTGLKIEMLIILLAVGTFVRLRQEKMWPVVKAVVGVYICLYLFAVTPSLLYVPGHVGSAAEFFDNSSQHVIVFLQKAIAASNIGHNSLHPTLNFMAPMRAFEMGFDYLASQIFYIVVCSLAAGWFRMTAPEKFIPIIKNSRPERVLFYLLFLMLGALFAVQRGLAAPLIWVDAFGAVTLLLAWYCSWMYAVQVNDIEDLAIDAISNPNRPLVKNLLSVEDMRQVSYLWLALSLVGTLSVGAYPFFFNLVYLACSHVYSASPLRLKRIPVLASLLISIAGLCAFLAGFYFLSMDKKLAAFPNSLALGILLILTLGVNMRDIKDIDGDRALGVLTLPLLFGKYGVHVVGGLFACGFLIAPWVLHLPNLVWAAVPAALTAFVIAIKKPYQESWVFILYFCFIVTTIGLEIVGKTP